MTLDAPHGPVPLSAASLLAISEWLGDRDLPASTDELLALLLRRHAPATVVEALATCSRRQVFSSVDEVLVEVLRRHGTG